MHQNNREGQQRARWVHSRYLHDGEGRFYHAESHKVHGLSGRTKEDMRVRTETKMQILSVCA